MWAAELTGGLLKLLKGPNGVFSGRMHSQCQVLGWCSRLSRASEDDRIQDTDEDNLSNWPWNPGYLGESELESVLRTGY